MGAAIITIEVQYEDTDETEVCSCAVPDVVRAEHHFNIGSGQMFGENGPGRLEHLAYIAWAFLRRRRGADQIPEFGPWLQTVATVDAIDPDALEDDAATGDGALGEASPES